MHVYLPPDAHLFGITAIADMSQTSVIILLMWVIWRSKVTPALGRSDNFHRDSLWSTDTVTAVTAVTVVTGVTGVMLSSSFTPVAQPHEKHRYQKEG